MITTRQFNDILKVPVRYFSNRHKVKALLNLYLTPKVGLTEMLERLKGFLYEVNNRRQKEDNRNLHD